MYKIGDNEVSFDFRVGCGRDEEVVDEIVSIHTADVFYEIMEVEALENPGYS